MPKYCPACLGEFETTITVCPKDQVALTTKKPPSFHQLIDIYTASDEIEAERLVTFLQSEGIVVHESTSGISQLPVVSDTRIYITVLKEMAKKAKALIEQARKDGVISTNGTFL